MKNFDRKRLVGSWQLQRWFITYEDGAVTEPLGPGAVGLLVYTPDGWMSAAMMAAGRSRLSRNNPRAAPVKEKATAFDTFFGYCCRWRIVGHVVEHHVAEPVPSRGQHDDPGRVAVDHQRHQAVHQHEVTQVVSA